MSASFARSLTFAGLAAALALAPACSTTKEGQKLQRAEVGDTLKKLEVIKLEVGEFPIDGATAVIDGDTIRVKGLDSSLRLLGLDTEETFKKDSERNAYAAGWEEYKKAMRGGSAHPVKMATPVGEDAKHFAQEFFEGATKVKIERDHPGEIRDYYGRYLAYVLVEKQPGQWLNYNVECVRAGMSPYFVKYGRSRRFHKEFVAAQEEAQKKQLGIWDPKKQHYDDYPERLKWWAEREQAVTRFEKQAEENPNYIALTRWDSMLKLEQKVGETVVILGSVNDVKMGDRGPTVVKLGRSRGNDFDVVFFDKDVLLASGISQNKGEYVQVRGVVNKYLDRRRNTHKLQLVVNLPGQVLAPSKELDQLLANDAAPPAKARREEDGE